MAYFVSTLITVVLSVIDISVLPRFSFYLGLPILVLPFLVIVSLRDRTIFPLFLSLIAGVIYGAAAGSLTYVVVFLLLTAIAKLFFGEGQNYNYFRSSLTLLLIGLIAILLSSWSVIAGSLRNPMLYVVVAIYLISSIILLPIYTLVGRRYFDYLDKFTAERFR